MAVFRALVFEHGHLYDNGVLHLFCGARILNWRLCPHCRLFDGLAGQIRANRQQVSSKTNISAEHNRSFFRDDQTLKKTLVEAVVFNWEILRIWALLRKTMREIIFYEFTISTYILCSDLIAIVLVSVIRLWWLAAHRSVYSAEHGLWSLRGDSKVHIGGLLYHRGHVRLLCCRRGHLHGVR